MDSDLAMIVIILVAVMSLFIILKNYEMAVLFAASATAVGIISYDPVSHEDRARAREEQAKIDMIPKPMSVVDGCTVYSFKKNGREHFFTRCENTVSTETNWSETCGKNCTKQMSESIQTEVKK